jgi:hypothetical protein
VKPQLLTKILAALLLGVLASKWGLVRIAVTNLPWSSVGFATLLFVLLSTASIVGLIRLQTWGFVYAYLLVPVSTFLHGITLVPFVTELLTSPELQSWAVAIVNVMFLGTLVVAHLLHARGPEPPGGGGSKIGHGDFLSGRHQPRAIRGPR